MDKSHQYCNYNKMANGVAMFTLIYPLKFTYLNDNINIMAQLLCCNSSTEINILCFSA